MQYKLTIPGRLPGLNELIEAELAHACLKEARRLRGENPMPKSTPECWLAISEELTDVQICIEVLEAAGYHGDPAMADVKRQRMVQRLDEAGK